MTSLRLHRLLVETYQLKVLLLENRLAFLEKEFLPRIEKALPVLAPQALRVVNRPDLTVEDITPKLIFDYIVQFDPDPVKKNAQWLLTLAVKGKLLLEDLPKAPEYLALFYKVQRRLPVEHRQLNKVQSLADLYTIIEPFEEQPHSQGEIDRAYDKEMREQAKIIYNGSDYRVLIPLTRAASCYFGVNTKWCTAAQSANQYEYYNNRAPLYIILDKKNNRRWQFQFAGARHRASFMDEADRPINVEEFLAAHPKIEQIFAHMEDDFVELGRIKGERQMLVALQDGNRILFKQKRGPFFPPEASILANEHGFIQDMIPSEMLEWDTPHSFVKILNQSGFKPSVAVARPLALYGIFYGNGKWGGFAEFATTIMEFNQTRWATIEMGNNHFFALLPHELLPDPVIECDINDQGVLNIYKPRIDDPQIGDRIIDLIEHVGGTIQSFDRESNFKLDEMNDAQIKRMVKVRPDLLGVTPLFRVTGDSELVRKKIVEVFSEKDISFEKWSENGLILETFKNVDSLVSEHGSEFLKRVADHFNASGRGDFEFGSDNVSDSDAEELYDNLDRHHRDWIAAYAKATYGDEEDAEESEDEDDDYNDIHSIDWDDPDDVWRVLQENDDDVITHLRWAVGSGLEVGSQDEMYEDYVKTIEHFDDEKPWTLIFQRRKNDKGEEFIVWEAPVIMLLPIKTAAELCDNPDDLDDIAYNGWIEGEFDIEEPRYGWSGYSEETALERAYDELRQVLPSELEPPAKQAA